MKIRRMTIAVLLLLTLLFIVDVRYLGDDRSTREPSIHFDLSPQMRERSVQEKQDFINPQGEFTSLTIKGQKGVIQLRSTDGDEIRVNSILGADSQDVIDRLEVKESIVGSELRYELAGEGSEGPQDVGLSFVVEAPAGMEVNVEQHFGEVKIDDFVGFLSLTTSFSDVDVRGLEGTATIQSSFGDVDLRQIAGPITLNDSFSTSTIGLLAIDGGYDFDVEITNGSLRHNAGFEVDIGENRVEARGKWGEGVHPVVIRSSFSTVTVNLEK